MLKISIFDISVEMTDLRLQPELLGTMSVNSSPTAQNGRHFVDNIFKCIFVNENFAIFI